MISKIKQELMKTLTALQAGSVEKFEGELIYNPDELNISERAVGGKVELIGQDGTLSVLPDGDYELSDGFRFTVTDGLISAIEGETPVEEVPSDMAEDAPVEDAQIPDGLSELKKENESIKAELDALKQLVSELMDASATKEDVSNFQSEVEKLNNTILTLAKIPAEPAKTNTSNVVKDKNDEKMMEFAKMCGTINKK